MDLKWPLEIDSAGRPLTVDGLDETKQRAEIGVGAQQGDWDFDISYGVPWIQLMSMKPWSPGLVRASLAQQLLRTPGLDTVESIVLDETGERELTASCRCTASGVQFDVEAG